MRRRAVALLAVLSVALLALSASTSTDLGIATGSASSVRATPTSAAPGNSFAAPTPTEVPQMNGVTVDDTTNVAAIVDSLRRLGRPMTVRVVFNVDWSAPADPAAMVDPVRQLAAVATVMGELVDSQDLARITVTQMAQRTAAYVKALGPWVSVWEVGNEVNGNWTGPADQVAAKVSTAYRQVQAAGGQSALTLYENTGCGDSPGELDPRAWAARWLPVDVRAGLAYLLLSYYETQCGARRPSPAEWTERFTALNPLFPTARLGFGEIGLPDPATPATVGTAASIVNYYYRLPVALPSFIGGCFYWNYVEDMTPAGRPLWRTLQQTLTG